MPSTIRLSERELFTAIRRCDKAKAWIERWRAHFGVRKLFFATTGEELTVGYPRTVQRPDGNIVTICYFHDQPRGDRYIAATIWSPADGSR